MAQHGGKRAGAGRKPGAVSKAKRALAEKAKDHAEAALETLVRLMDEGDTDSVKLQAANAILDRGYGKPFQATGEVAPEQAQAAFDGWAIETIEPASG